MAHSEIDEQFRQFVGEQCTHGYNGLLLFIYIFIPLQSAQVPAAVTK